MHPEPRRSRTRISPPLALTPFSVLNEVGEDGRKDLMVGVHSHVRNSCSMDWNIGSPLEKAGNVLVRDLTIAGA
jgi:hypothetical protein